MAATGFEPAPTTTIVADQTEFAAPMANISDFDPADALPAICAEKLRMLRQRAADLHTLVPTFENISDLNLEKIKVERELSRLLARESDNGFNLPPSDSRVLAAQRRADKLSAELARVTEIKKTREAAWQIASRVLSEVEQWLRNGKPRGTTLEAVETEAPKLLKNENISDAIARFRSRAQELKNALAKISAAKLPSPLVKTRIREQVAALAAKGAPNVHDLIARDDGKLVFPKQMLRAQVLNTPKAPAATAYGEIVEPTALVAWLLRDRLIEALFALVDEQKDDASALSPELRQQRAAEAQGGLLAVERGEATLVWMAQAQGLSIEHRPDCAPEGILQCRLVVVPRALPSPGSSLEHAFGVVG
jgi:hypothetical protein